MMNFDNLSEEETEAVGFAIAHTLATLRERRSQYAMELQTPTTQERRMKDHLAVLGKMYATR